MFSSAVSYSHLCANVNLMVLGFSYGEVSLWREPLKIPFCGHELGELGVIWKIKMARVSRTHLGSVGRMCVLQSRWLSEVVCVRIISYNEETNACAGVFKKTMFIVYVCILSSPCCSNKWITHIILLWVLVLIFN